MTKYIQLGLDYGTSAAKMIFRDFQATGGERSYVIDDFEGSFRVPTMVVYDETKGEFLFGRKNASGIGSPLVYHSVKMRLAEEIKKDGKKYFYGTQIQFPDGVRARDIAISTVWYLAVAARTRILQFYGVGGDNLKMSMTMGIPMSFYNDAMLKEGFLDIVRSAYWLLKHQDDRIIRDGCLSLENLRRLSELARNKVQEAPAPDTNTIRDWLRTEAESALMWAFTSPNVKQGLYAKADVGAGTTNASIFRITEKMDKRTGQWQKEGLAFFGATSEAVGIDSIDEIFEKQDIKDCQGNEEELLKKYPAIRDKCRNYIDKMHEAVETAWSIAYSKQKDVNQWLQLNIFVFGGGSQISMVRQKMRLHPYVNRSFLSEKEKNIQIVELDKPSDLFEISKRPLSEKDLPFLLVAYGLSNSRLSIREVKTPNEIMSIPPPEKVERTFVPYDDL